MGRVIDETAGLLLNFPDRGNDLRRLYMASETFRELVRDFNDAAVALNFWTTVGNADRQREYQYVLTELEFAILDLLGAPSARGNSVDKDRDPNIRK